MKWMGGWGWREFLSAPAELVDEAERMIQAEAEEIERIRMGNSRSRPAPFRADRDHSGRARIAKTESPEKEPRAALKTEIDPRTGREVVTTVRPDGSVVKHRKIEEGEQLLHMMFGKPKSFQNK